MTNEEINIAIAKACGWTDIQEYQILTEPDSPWFVSGLQPEEWKGVDRRPWLPNFCNDLNAMHEAEKILPDLHLYLRFLYLVVLDDGTNAANELAFATAAQRAEAFLRTLNLWTE